MTKPTQADMDDNVIKIMAQAGCVSGDMDSCKKFCGGCIPEMEAAIEALTEAGYDIKKRDDTMVTVPREPTYAMTLAGHKATKHQFDLHGAYTKLFTAMIKAYEAEKADE